MNSERINADVTIVGGGMVGASIALGLLQQTNYTVALIEPLPPSPPDLNAEPHIRLSALNLHSIDWLTGLGAWDNIKALRAHPYTALSVTEKLNIPVLGKLNRTRFESSSVHEDVLGYMVENHVTQYGLWQALESHINSGRCILTNPDFSLTQIDQSEKEAILSLRAKDGRTLAIHSGLAIGCDGARSKVRELSSISVHSKPYTQHAFVIGVELSEPAGEETWQAFKPTGPAALLPMMSINHDGEEKHYGVLVWYDKPETIQALLSLSYEELAQRAQAHFPSILPNIVRVYQRGEFPLTKMHVDRYMNNRIVLAGDAAHTINPLAGQGVNLGFKDAHALVNLLTEFSKSHSIFDSKAKLTECLKQYESQRRKPNALMLNAMDLFYYGFSSEKAPLKVLRNTVLTMAQNSGPIKKQVLKYALGL